MIIISIQHVIAQRVLAVVGSFKSAWLAFSFFAGAKRRWLPVVLLSLLILPTALCAAAPQQIQVTWSYSGAAVDLAGFRLYKDASLACTSNDPAARTLTCTVDLGGTSALFTMTAFDVNGAESSQSTSFTLTPPGANQAPLAVAKANVLTGPASLAVFFDGSSSSDTGGYVAKYSWNFGDGASGAGVAVDHTYTLPGHYDAVLTVTDDSGAMAQSVISIQVTGVGAGTDTFPSETSRNGLDSSGVTVPTTIAAQSGLSTPGAATSLTATNAGGGGGGCSLAVGQRSPTQAADWFMLGSCFVWLAVRRLKRR